MKFNCKIWLSSGIESRQRDSILVESERWRRDKSGLLCIQVYVAIWQLRVVTLGVRETLKLVSKSRSILAAMFKNLTARCIQLYVA